MPLLPFVNESTHTCLRKSAPLSWGSVQWDAGTAVTSGFQVDYEADDGSTMHN